MKKFKTYNSNKKRGPSLLNKQKHDTFAFANERIKR